MKVALVYDRVNKWGGAERVLLALHELFPEAPLYTSVHNVESSSWAKVFRIIPSFVQQLPYAKKAHEFYPLFMPGAFETFQFDEYDLVISVTSEAAKGIITKPQTIHICYCLTPTRYLWSGYQEYFTSKLSRIFAFPAISYLRKWEKVGASRPDAFIAISAEVKDRISKYYSRNSEVIHPPVSLVSEKKRRVKREEYYLVVSRLVSYKRIDLAIRACNQLKRKLVIVGTGSQEKKLKSIAGPTITFVGSVTENQLKEYYAKCKAFLFPGREDFGITMVEAMSYGAPVIAYSQGGALDIIVADKTGVLFDEQNTESLVAAMRKFEKMSFLPAVLMEQAELFSKDIFHAKMLSYLQRYFAKL
jgi:glycosyltransferase involved in cell wall biosynthesis